jgi:uncharacterized protein (DUF924 family)
MTATATPLEIATFWRDAGPGKWFTPDHDFDHTVRSKFLAVHEAAAAGRLAAWQETREGALALVLLLDQFPRNMFRGQARAFATDAMARALAARALACGFDQATDPMMRPFFYLPSCTQRRSPIRIAVCCFTKRSTMRSNCATPKTIAP